MDYNFHPVMGSVEIPEPEDVVVETPFHPVLGFTPNG